MKRNKKKNKIKKIVLLVSFILLIIVSAAGFFIYQNNLVYNVCRVEAGVDVSVGDFLKKADKNAYFTRDSEPIDITVPGEYHVKIKTGFFTHDSTLYIEDTIAPAVSVQPVKIENGGTCEAGDFVTSIDDATATTVSFGKEPDYSMEGSQNIVIAVTDAGGNVTKAESELIIYSVATELNMEVGSAPPSISDFGSEDSDVRLVTDMSTIDFSKIGSHTLQVDVDGKQYDVSLNIVDTVAPVFEVRDIIAYAMNERTPEEFVTGVQDATAVTYAFEGNPDFSFIGTQTIKIIATDEAGNQAVREAELSLMEDKEPPRIVGASDMDVYVGNSISYRANVRAEDNCAENLRLSVDSGAVNLNVAGTYPVTYVATDAAGNSTSVTINVTVRERVYSEDEVYSIADGILARIITDGMSQYDKALAIFNYVKGHVAYVDSSEKGNWVKAAFEGLTNSRGDCYVYACVSKALLTRAGIPNLDIERIPAGTTLHYWNLVDIGDGHGWYHFDTTPRWNHPTIFLWTEAQLMEYSRNNYNSHNYDHSVYPEVP